MRVTPKLLAALALEPLFDEDVPGTQEAPPPPVVDPRGLPYLLSVEQVAAVLATTPAAIYARVERGQLDVRHGLRRTGRKVQFLRDQLLASLETMTDGRGRR